MSKNDQSVNGPKKGICECGTFDKTKFSFSELDTQNEKTKGQMIAYPRYTTETGEGNYVFRTKKITLSHYGIPRPGQYYNSDSDRCFIKIPLDRLNEASCELEDHLVAMDECIDSKEMKNKIFGPGLAPKMTYTPLARTPEDLSDIIDPKANNGKPRGPRPRFCKMKFDTNWEDGTIKTAVYVKKTPTGPAEKVRVTTLQDLESYISLGAKLRMVILVNKLWGAKTPKGGVRNFGVTLKIVQLLIEPSDRKSNRQEYTTFAFGDDEGEEEETSAPTPDPAANKTPKKQFTGDVEDEPEEEPEEGDADPEEDPEEEPEEEEEPEPEPPRRGAKKPAARGRR